MPHINDLIQAAVDAKLAFWDALRDLERASAKGGEYTDHENDAVCDFIDLLAAGSDAGSPDIDASIVADYKKLLRK